MVNIAGILKGYPRGTKLYSPIFGDCTLVKALDDIIEIRPCASDNTYLFYSDGTYVRSGECLLFPSKEQRDWSLLQKPFNEGDVISNNHFIAIFCKFECGHLYYHCWCHKTKEDTKFKIDFGIGFINDFTYATEEEKEKLFKAIKENGYKWNNETKTLEKLIEPKFKVGDKIVKRNSITNPWIVNSVSSEYYGLKLHKDSEAIGVLTVSEQDDYELVPDKFEISSLKPFDKVLTRANDDDTWVCNLYSHRMKDYHVILNAELAVQCIPYEGNELLLGTNNDCDEFYKTW